jgi:hypothetical protein
MAFQCAIALIRAKLLRPAPNRFVRNDDAALQQHLFEQTQAQRKSNVQPDRMGNDSRRKVMRLQLTVAWILAADDQPRASAAVNLTSPAAEDEALRHAQMFVEAIANAARSKSGCPAVIATLPLPLRLPRPKPLHPVRAFASGCAST